MTTAIQRSFSERKVHGGNAIIDASNTYRTVQTTLYEVVQNAIDAGAKNIWINIEYRSRNRVIVARDDGEGSTFEKFSSALSSVYQTIKGKSTGKYGQFGKGLVAPITKCRRYEFTAYDPEVNFYRMWTFEHNEIQAESDSPQIPFTQRSTLMQPVPGRKSVKRHPWNTEVKMTGVTKDRRLSEIDPKTFKSDIVNHFRAKMLENGIKIHLNISTKSDEEYTDSFTASAYTGDPIPEEDVEIDDVSARMTLFRARLGSGGRKGEVSVGCADDPFRFNISKYFKNNGTEGLTAEAVKFFKSGIIEGDIVVKGLTLDSRRDRFDQSQNLTDFNLCLQTWYDDVGKQIAKEVSSDSMRERFLDGSKVAVSIAEKVLSSRNSRAVWDFIQTFELGSVGDGHKPPKKNKKVGETDDKVTRPGSAHGDGTKKVSGQRKRSSKPKATPEKDNPGDTPWLVAGTGRHKRTYVKSDSLGLTVELIEMEGRSDMWELDTQTGTLFINQRHYTLARVADKDSTLSEYLTDLIIHALNFEAKFSSDMISNETRDNALELVGDILDSVATKLLMKV